MLIKGRILKYFFGLILLFAKFNGYAEKNPNLDYIVDSICEANFLIMQKAIDSNLLYDNYVDRYFIHLISYISEIECNNIDFTGFCYFDQNKLEQWQNWYFKNREFIISDLFIRGLKIIRDEKRTHEQLDSLNMIVLYEQKTSE